jgi:hypothetical protein
VLVSSVPLSETRAAGLPRSAIIAIEFAPDPQARQRGIGHQRQALSGEIVDDGENAEAPAVTELIVQKIHRPALVWTLWQGQRCPGAKRPLEPAATANLEPFLGVDATRSETRYWAHIYGIRRILELRDEQPKEKGQEYYGQ